MLDKIVYAGVHSTTSYEAAEHNLEKLAEFKISTSHIHRITSRVAKEFDKKDYETSNLLEDLPQPEQIQVKVASISVDGGRTQIREENSGPGVHNPRWIESKAGCLQILDSQESDTDPHPLLPKIFQDKKAVKSMVEGLKGNRNNQKNSENLKQTNKTTYKIEPVKKEEETPYRPKVLKRYVVGDINNAETFGHLLYRKMYQHNLHSASRKAYICDGDQKLWTTIYEENFRADGWTPILDIVHAIEYIYEAAKVTTDTENKCWRHYMEYADFLWAGKPLTIIRRLDKNIKQLQNSKKSKSKYIQDKIDRLNVIRTYFKNNFTKMDYPLYRKKGLPISSCYVESLIKQFNIRIKSSEKFWNRSAVKGVIKIKGALLSDDDNSWTEFWENRAQQQAKSKMVYNRKKQLKAA
jgi:hypothetical protein